ncbi:MAG TPA: FAD-dependent oxidoreductase [Ilumatobacteraceae bacterium]|nr:FAD-dependent oxidoreductase [Ilumatobacteraceae bacterium]
MATSFDTAVVGLGLVGAAALRHLSATGQHCVGVGPTEPLDWSSHRGVFASHYDSGRITRRLDKRREWAVLAARAIDAYPDIEARSAIPFHHPVGVVMADVDPERLSAVVAVGHALGVDFHTYQPGEPLEDDRISVPTGSMVLREPSPGGFIDPRRMLAAQLTICTQHGATVVSEQVTGIEQSGNGWSVHAVDGSSIEADHVVIAAGPHADEIAGLPRTPLIDVVAETVVMARLSTEEQLRLAGLPSIIVDGPEDHLYIVPPTEYPDGHVYVKLGATRHDHWVLAADERRDWMTGTFHAADLDWLHGLLVGALPGLHAEGWSTKPCLIPDTPTKLPYLEIIEPGLVMAVGSNGYAAKSADAIGALAAGLVVNGRWTDPELDEQSFKLISRD